MMHDDDTMAIVIDRGQMAARAVQTPFGNGVELAFRAGDGAPTALIAYMGADEAVTFAIAIVEAATQSKLADGWEFND